jgi:biopolymer transport protein ExbD
MLMQRNPSSRQLSLATQIPRRRAAIRLTPLIDVVFILLVFFMLTSSFLDWRTIPLETSLASSAERYSGEKTPLLVDVVSTETRLNGQVLPMDQLVRQLEQRLEDDPDLTVQVRPIGATRLQAVIDVLDRLTLSGITRLKLVRDRGWEAARGSGS